MGYLAVSDPSDLGAPLVALGVELVAAADPPLFELPCPAVEAGVCTVYHLHRPRACEQYECDLVRAVQVGAVAPCGARSVIAETLALRDRVNAGEADPAELRERLRRHFRRDLGS